MIDFVLLDIHDKQLRRNYFLNLEEPQEFFIERLISNGFWWAIIQNNQQCGYAITDGNDTLLELHLSQNVTFGMIETIEALRVKCGIRNVIVKSFDQNIYLSCLSVSTHHEVIGLLYRVVSNLDFYERPDIIARLATHLDVSNLTKISDDFFDDASEIESYIHHDGLIIYEMIDGNIIGAGVVKRVITDLDDFDIGMVIHSGMRQRGYGTYIVSHLKSYCLTNGWRPICGCSIDNIASQKTLERAGFVSRHRLIKFWL